MTISDKPLPRTDRSLNEKDISRFLRDNPNFFTNHPDLIEDLILTHESGKAVSLIEKQVSVLRDRNMDMRHRLSDLLDNARDNDRLFDKTKRLVLALIDANDLGDLVDALYYSFDNEFEVEHTQLILFGDQQAIPASSAKIVPHSAAQNHLGERIKSTRSVCGGIRGEEIKYIFEQRADKINSAALAMLYHGNSIGVLAVGNSAKDYYNSGMGTLFLSYIAEILNRLLPKHLPKQR